MLYAIRDLTDNNTRELTDDEKSALAAAFEDAAIEVLVKKTAKAAEEFYTQTIIVGGGVSGNSYLKEQLTQYIAKKLPGVAVLFPEPWLATDNAVMIGLAAYARIKNDSFVVQSAGTLKAQGNLSLSK
jgi:N6-L-threonylcarbamoyladenine synthase